MSIYKGVYKTLPVYIANFSIRFIKQSKYKTGLSSPHSICISPHSLFSSVSRRLLLLVCTFGHHFHIPLNMSWYVFYLVLWANIELYHTSCWLERLGMWNLWRCCGLGPRSSQGQQHYDCCIWTSWLSLFKGRLQRHIRVWEDCRDDFGQRAWVDRG